MNRFARKFPIFVASLLLLAACTPAATAAPLATATSIATTPSAIPTATSLPQLQADYKAPAGLEGYYFGVLNASDQTPFVSAVSGPAFEAKNPGDIIPTVGGAHESRFETLYVKENPQLTAAFLIDPNFLTQYFNAETTKTGTTGTLQDGTVVEYTGNVWLIHQADGTDLVFNPLILSEAGKPFGSPAIYEKTVSGKKTLMVALVDPQDNIVSEQAAFQKASEVAADAGYSADPQNPVISAGLKANGQLQLTLKDGSITSLDYAETSAVKNVELGNFEDPTTWPTNYEGMNLQDYWNKTDFTTNGRPDQEKAKQEDQIFDDFCNASMKKTLTDSGVDTSKLTDDQIFEKYLEWSQQNKEIVTISPQRIRNILGDINNWLTIAYTDNNGNIKMGIIAGGQKAYNPDDVNNTIRPLIQNKRGIVSPNIFGIKTTIPAQSYEGVNGYLSLFRLPGIDEKIQAVGALASYPDYQDNTITRYFPTIINFEWVNLPKGSPALWVGEDNSPGYELVNIQKDDKLEPTFLNSDQRKTATYEKIKTFIGKNVYMADGPLTSNNIINTDVYPYELGIPQTFMVNSLEIPVN